MLKKAYLLLAFALVGLLVPVAIGASAEDDGGEPPDIETAQVTAIEPAAMDALGVFREERSTADALPAEYAERMDRRASFGMNPALSRRAIANATSSVYVIPARDHVCASLTDPDGVTTICPSTADVAHGRVGAATVGFDVGIAVYGLVPDGVDVVSVATDAGAREVGTEGNAYYTVVPADDRVKSVSYVGPGGPVEFALQDPRLAVSEP